MIRVVGQAVPLSGIHYHRIINPFAYMPRQQDMEFTISEHGKPLPECEVLVFNKWMDISPQQILALKDQGVKIVCDVDDIWRVPKTHHNSQSITERGIDKITEENMKLADIVLCTTELLRQQILPFNKNVEIAPNALPFGRDQYVVGDRDRARQISGHNKMVFMYLAGSTHKEDVDLLKKPFAAIGDNGWMSKESEYMLCGYTEHKTGVYATKEDYDARNNNYTMKVTHGPYDSMANVFRSTKSFRIYPAVDLDHYLNYYDTANIAIAPLRDNEWNSCKSELKIIEAACKKVPIICSNVAPYKEFTGRPGVTTVMGPGQWKGAIRNYIIKGQEYAQEQGELLHEWCSKEYDLIKVNEKRLQIFRSLC